MNAEKLKIDIHQGLAGLESIYDIWNELAASYGAHFLHYPAWYKAREISSKLSNRRYYMTLRDDRGLAAVIPFEEDTIKAGPFNIPCLVLSYPNEMGVCDGLSRVDLSGLQKRIKNATSSIPSKFFFMKLGGVPEGASLSKSGFNHLTELRKYSHETKYLDISKGREEFYENYSAKFKRNLRRKLKKANEIGEVQFKSVSATDDEIEQAFRIFLSIEDSGWKGEQGTSIAKQPEKLAYYEALYELYKEIGLLNINLLYVSDKCIAAQFGIKIEGVLYLLKVAYDEAHSAVSPGHLLIDALITEDQSGKALKKISFVTGVTWIDVWKPSSEKVFVSYIFNNKIIQSMAKIYQTMIMKRRV